MKECSYQELLQAVDASGKDERALAVFVFSPFCGTCRVAARMLDILEGMLKGLPLYSCNINLMPQLASEWEITSIPCLLVIQGGQVADRRYRMESIDGLYSFLQPYLPV